MIYPKKENASRLKTRSRRAYVGTPKRIFHRRFRFATLRAAGVMVKYVNFPWADITSKMEGWWGSSQERALSGATQRPAWWRAFRWSFLRMARRTPRIALEHVRRRCYVGAPRHPRHRRL